MKKRLAVLLMAGILGVSMAACGGNEEKKDLETAGNEGKSEDKIPLKISHHPYLHALPSIYAEDKIGRAHV